MLLIVLLFVLSCSKSLALNNFKASDFLSYDKMDANLNVNKEKSQISERLLEFESINLYSYTKLLNRSDDVENHLVEFTGTDVNYQKSGNDIVRSIVLTIEHYNSTQFRVKMTDMTKKRWEVPNEYPFAHYKGLKTTTNSQFLIEFTKEGEFGFWITRKSTNEVIFDTRSFAFVYSDLYIDISSKIPTENLYGIGERACRLKMGPTGTYTIWARDRPKVIDRGYSGGHIYGHHPVYLMQEKSNNWHIVLFRSSNAMDVTMNDGKDIRFRVAGGIVDLVFILGDRNPETAIKQYHEYIGKWVMMPFWSMGWHQSRWGYTNLNTLKQKVDMYREIRAPIDVIWTDLDYMINKEDFTIDSTKFPLEEFNTWLKDGKIKWVPIIDAGVSKRFNNELGYSEGIRRDVFIKNSQGQPMLGTVWPGESHYVDWFNDKSEEYWGDMIERLYTHVKFSGIWLDMNEPTNFGNGEVGREWQRSRYDDLPYTPGAQPLKTMTISMDGAHSGGIIEFDVHDLFGTLESKATYLYLKKKSPLPFILTRSNAFGAGQFAAHWTGDNGASWDFMRYATTGIFQFGIFGMPFTGADICGFMDSTTPELCARWHQAGALYPFSRNHNHIEARDQEPWAFMEDFVKVTAVKAIQLRYSLLKWYYSQFIEKNGTGLVFKPIVFEFPEDQMLYKMDNFYSDDQIMIGNSLMAIPVYNPSIIKPPAYFPSAKWYNFFTGEIVHNNLTSGLLTQVDAPLGEYIPLYIRGGYIVHKQNIENVEWSGDLDNKYDLIIAFNETAYNEQVKYEASGIIMALKSFDDQSIHNRCILNNCLIEIRALAEKTASNSIRITVNFKAQAADEIIARNLDSVFVNSITMFGLPILSNSASLPGVFENTQKEVPKIINISNDKSRSLKFKDDQVEISGNITLKFIITTSD